MLKTYLTVLLILLMGAYGLSQDFDKGSKQAVLKLSGLT
jgi:hypothetical protein